MYRWERLVFFRRVFEPAILALAIESPKTGAACTYIGISYFILSHSRLNSVLQVFFFRSEVGTKWECEVAEKEEETRALIGGDAESNGFSDVAWWRVGIDCG